MKDRPYTKRGILSVHGQLYDTPGGGVVNKVIYGEAPRRGPASYPFTYHFWQKRYPSHIPSL